MILFIYVGKLCVQPHFPYKGLPCEDTVVVSQKDYQSMSVNLTNVYSMCKIWGENSKTLKQFC